MSDSTKNFSGRAEDYTVGRPTYAKEFIEYLYGQGEPQYQEYIMALENLFERYAEDGVLKMPNQTVAYIGKIVK